MIKRTQTLPIPNEYIQFLSQFTENIKNLLFFDIETTGFHRSKDSLVSITFLSIIEEPPLSLTFDSDHTKYAMEVSQFFCEAPDEELTLLNTCLPFFTNYPIYITYNGHAFDIPFISAKYRYYNIFLTFNKCMSFDLYVISRKLLTLDSYKLKSVENALGIERTDSISGLECIQLYKTYQDSKDIEIVNLILHHNLEDVINMLHLTKVVNKNETYFEKSKWVRYFMSNSLRIYLYDCIIKKDMILIQIYTNLALKKYYFRNDLISCSLLEPNLYQVEFRMTSVNYQGILMTIPCSHTTDFFDSLEMHQQILQYNNEWVYDNILILVEKLIPLFTESV